MKPALILLSCSALGMAASVARSQNDNEQATAPRASPADLAPRSAAPEDLAEFVESILHLRAEDNVNDENVLLQKRGGGGRGGGSSSGSSGAGEGEEGSSGSSSGSGSSGSSSSSSGTGEYSSAAGAIHPAAATSAAGLLAVAACFAML